ncbi:VapE domain-containing protein [Variovorax ginsengisoli]|uniref:Virulence-associated protein E-like domain-containing protein n=1 Tax=Variovorax ginsengisoli TaxID=363844 RepID=A0ABT9SGT9_9BURK|nr:VapE domain-containing protein [Variovorax ginsengisoli]MDP9902627.1 hypothetical protein [Variovorax ginsengisoli]
MSRAPLPPINFTALAEALLARADELVPLWLPGGVRQINEYVCGSLSGGEGKSFSVNLKNGRWSDFATGEAGGDLISLYAAVFGLEPGKAVVAVARETGLEDVAGLIKVADGTAPPPPPRPPPASAKPAREDEGWTTVMPVPTNAPLATFRHFARAPEDLVYTATYRVGDHLLGYTVRFLKSDGSKDVLPYTWCISARDGAAKWHWKQWDEPRPLYYPGAAHPAGRTVICVEGEKKADSLQQLLDATAPGIFCVVSWPGGGKAWSKATWEWIAGHTVLLWPDCDAKREKLTKVERDALLGDSEAIKLAEAIKPLLPEHKQPGFATMLALGAALRDAHGCTVQILPIPKPLEVPDGWDCGDAIHTDSWPFTRVMNLFARAQALPLSDADKAAQAAASTKKGKGASAGGGGAGNGGDGPPRDPPASAGDGEDAFQEHIDFMCAQNDCKPYQIGVTRKLIVAALRKAPDLQQCVGFDELRGAPCTRVAWPWRASPGPLGDTDDLRLGDYLEQTYKLKSASRAALTEGIDTVADEVRFHPVRDWLNDLQHDGKPRLDKWLIHVLGMDPEKLKPRRRRYLELVGRFLLMGLVARVFEPGCKFDYSPVFEGPGGIGKSTFVKVLVGKQFFSDTHFDIGNGKEGMEQLEGLWAYELSEMTAFRRADSEQVKAFFSSTIDRFRGAYGKFVQPHPRQCVIFCTTNKRRYLYDLTGNRRFWPIWINSPILLAWLEKFRDQLFAEAVAAYKAKERYYPTREEEDEFFVPEQMKRLADTSVQSRLYELLTREGAAGAEARLTVEYSQHTTFLTLHGLVAALGADAAKSTTLLENQVRSWLEFMGWTVGREGGGQRRRGYKAPPVWPPAPGDDDEDEDDERTTQQPRPPGDGPKHDQPPAEVESYGGGDDEPF